MEIRNVNPPKIVDEFNNAGIKPYNIFDNLDGTGNFSFPEGTDMDLVQQIIDAHDPTPLPPQPTEQERIEALEQAMLEMIMGGM